MKIAYSTVLVTGANRGLGRALAEEALGRGAKRVYAGARQPFAHANRRVTPLMLDIINAAQIRAAVPATRPSAGLLNTSRKCLSNQKQHAHRCAASARGSRTGAMNNPQREMS
jgi:NAD(P)-dependent dehydrogenase (short-subunit alcohol dehydrogenase family)